jgi:excisionase family DNA binding protein
VTDREPLLDIQEAAGFLNVSETSLRRWTNAGRLSCVRVGRRRERRFRRADLLAFLEHQVAPSRPSDRYATIEGVPVVEGSHFAGLYGTDGGRVRLAAGFLADGLGAGIVCYLVAKPQVQKAIKAELTGANRSLQQDIDAGRLVCGEYRASVRAQLDYWGTQFGAALRGGARSLRVVGDVTSTCSKWQGVEAAVEYEVGYEQLIARRFPVVTLCQYDARKLSGVDLLAVLKCHHDTYAYPADRLLA